MPKSDGTTPTSTPIGTPKMEREKSFTSTENSSYRRTPTSTRSSRTTYRRKSSGDDIPTYNNTTNPGTTSTGTKQETNSMYNNNTILPTPKSPERCPLLCCFYAEFDIKVGPKICYQSPCNFMEQDIGLSANEMSKLLIDVFKTTEDENNNNKDDDDNNTNTNTDLDETPVTSQRKTSLSTKQRDVVTDDSNNEQQQQNQQNQQQQYYSIFDSCSEYIITGNELTGNIINLSSHHIHVLTRPTILSDEKYERNSLLFCLGFILRRTEDPRPFRPVLSKLALTLRDMEIETQFLSNTNTREQLQYVLKNVLISLNSDKGECNMILGKYDILNLKLFRPPKMPAIPVKDYSVPILLRRDWQIQTYDWDLSINWVSLHIDGIKNARQISKKAEVDMEMVRACLRVLKHHGVIGFVDMFFYSNRYECTDKIGQLMDDHSKLLQKAAEFVIKKRVLGTGQNSSTSGVGGAVGGGDASSPEFHSTSPLTAHGRFIEQQRHGGPLSSSPIFSEPIKEGHLLIGSHKANMSGSQYSQQDVVFASVMKREEYNEIKAAIADFFSGCRRDITVGDLWINLVARGSSDSTRINWKSIFKTIDHRRLTTFGLINGLIRRVHNYPMLLDNAISTPRPNVNMIVDTSLLTSQERVRPLNQQQMRLVQQEERRKLTLKAASLMDGQHCDDELVCTLEIPLVDVFSLFPGRKITSVFAPAIEGV